MATCWDKTPDKISLYKTNVNANDGVGKDHDNFTDNHIQAALARARILARVSRIRFDVEVLVLIGADAMKECAEVLFADASDYKSVVTIYVNPNNEVNDNII